MLQRCAARVYKQQRPTRIIQHLTAGPPASSLPIIMSYAQIARSSTSRRTVSTAAVTTPGLQPLSTRAMAAPQAGPVVTRQTVVATSVRTNSASPSTPDAVTVRRAFISGHIDLTDELFQMHYAPAIDVALAEGHQFIIGDALGVDSMALAYILARGGPEVVPRITVFPSRPHNIEKLRLRGIKVSVPDHQQAQELKQPRQAHKGRDASRLHHLARDAQMTAASDYDILYVRTDEEAKALYGAKWRPRVSGTELNRRRRLELATSTGALSSPKHMELT